MARPSTKKTSTAAQAEQNQNDDESRASTVDSNQGETNRPERTVVDTTDFPWKSDSDEYLTAEMLVLSLK